MGRGRKDEERGKGREKYRGEEVNGVGEANCVGGGKQGEEEGKEGEKLERRERARESVENLKDESLGREQSRGKER